MKDTHEQPLYVCFGDDCGRIRVCEVSDFREEVVQEME